MEFVITEGSYYDGPGNGSGVTGDPVGRASSAADAVILAVAHLLRYPNDVVHIERES